MAVRSPSSQSRFPLAERVQPALNTKAAPPGPFEVDVASHHAYHEL